MGEILKLTNFNFVLFKVYPCNKRGSKGLSDTYVTDKYYMINNISSMIQQN